MVAIMRTRLIFKYFLNNYSLKTFKMACSLPIFWSLPRFLLCVLAMKLLVFKVGCKLAHASRVSEAREVDASEWMRLQYSDAVREDFLVRGKYIDFEQPWINLVHSAAMPWVGAQISSLIVFLAM